jgi:hypothetical protein
LPVAQDESLTLLAEIAPSRLVLVATGLSCKPESTSSASGIPTRTGDVNCKPPRAATSRSPGTILRDSTPICAVIDKNWGGISFVGRKRRQLAPETQNAGYPLARNFAALCSIAAAQALWFTGILESTRTGK